MTDSSVTKVASGSSPRGELGQKYLAAGVHVGMRLWEKEPEKEKDFSKREYETVGYVIQGRATLELEGQTINLEAGDSWTVPKGASHRYTIHESLTAVEATSPPAFAKGRDEVQQPYAAPNEIERDDRPRPVPR